MCVHPLFSTVQKVDESSYLRFHTVVLGVLCLSGKSQKRKEVKQLSEGGSFTTKITLTLRTSTRSSQNQLFIELDLLAQF